MAGTAGRSTSDSPDAQQLYEAADAAKEAAEADNLLDAVEIERHVLFSSGCLHDGPSLCAHAPMQTYNQSPGMIGELIMLTVLSCCRLKKDDGDKRRRGQTEADKKPSGKTLPRTFTIKPTGAQTTRCTIRQAAYRGHV